MTAEDRGELWWLAAPAVLWVGHFLASYAMVAIWCARFAPVDGDLGPIGVTFAALTLVALAGLAVTGVRSVRRYVAVPPEVPEADSDVARHRFLALATLLLSGLATLGIGLVALSFGVVGVCR